LVIPSTTRVDVVGRSRVRRSDHTCPLSQPSFQLVAQQSRREPGPDLPTPRQRNRLPRSRASSIGKSRSLRPTLAPRTSLCGPPLVSRFCHRDPASDMRSRTTLRARPKHLTGYSPEPLGHMTPTDFCSWETHEHTNVRLNLVACAAASRRAIEKRLPLREIACQASTGQGAFHARCVGDPPSKRPLVRRIYPDLLHLDTPCHD
jgi:hypothetical protein